MLVWIFKLRCAILCVKKYQRRLATATNLDIDPQLLDKALVISGLKTKKETVDLALREFVNRHKQPEILTLFGKMDPEPEYDYKKGRTR